jgi:hypothetical protein
MADERPTIDETIRATIEMRVESVWAGRTKIQWPGVDGIGGDTEEASELPPTGAEWLRVSYEYAETDIATIAPDSGGLNRTSGVIALTVFTPSGLGMAPLLALAGPAKSIFDRYNNKIVCGASGIKHKPPRGGWNSANVVTPFHFYASIT